MAKEAGEVLYLKRKIDAFLAEWKANPDRKPLIVKGPRQVGKTESIKRFGEINYQSVITINFVEEPKYKMITADGYRQMTSSRTSPEWTRPNGLLRAKH